MDMKTRSKRFSIFNFHAFPEDSNLCEYIRPSIAELTTFEEEILGEKVWACWVCLTKRVCCVANDSGWRKTASAVDLKILDLRKRRASACMTHILDS